MTTLHEMAIEDMIDPRGVNEDAVTAFKRQNATLVEMLEKERMVRRVYENFCDWPIAGWFVRRRINRALLDYRLRRLERDL